VREHIWEPIKNLLYHHGKGSQVSWIISK
jgi:hypothetical protein